MKINLVIMSDSPAPPAGTMCEVQLPEGDTLLSGGLEVAKFFSKYKPMPGARHGSDAGWRFIPYDIDPYEATGPLGTALQAEARRGAAKG